jgi:hypothetical protein
MDSTDATPSAAPTARALTHTVLSMLLRSAAIALVLALPMASGSSITVDAPAATKQVQQQADDPLWKAAYSERYPGCVPSVLWPADEQPVAVVTRTPDGRIDRVALDEARMLVRDVPAGARAIGACR